MWLLRLSVLIATIGMRVLGLTGGIATGKSTAASFLKKLDPKAVVFDADVCVAELYQQDVVLEGVARIAGRDVLMSNRQIDRTLLRERVFSEPGLKKSLEDLVHPLVRKECLASLERAANTESTTSFIADVPLLFEGAFDFGQDANLVVAVSQQTQVHRLKMRNGFDDVAVHAILEAQFPISYKEKCADIVFWNEGPPAVLKAQIKRFINNNYR